MTAKKHGPNRRLNATTQQLVAWSKTNKSTHARRKESFIKGLTAFDYTTHAVCLECYSIVMLRADGTLRGHRASGVTCIGATPRS